MNSTYLPFLLRAYQGSETHPSSKQRRTAIDDVILSILANMAFEEKLREKIINFKRLNEVIGQDTQEKERCTPTAG
jgi:hypothetical protein